MYETIKRHGETYVYQGTTCIAIATAEGEKAVEELVQKSNQGDVNQSIADALQEILDSGADDPRGGARAVAVGQLPPLTDPDPPSARSGDAGALEVSEGGAFPPWSYDV